ncbi:MAG: pilin [Candidatus Peribacteria bacterium]|nr:pilin [Candidatus Peribacteria bacterium]
MGAAGVGDGSLQEDKLITSAKNFINWMLGMLATIALVICLYAGFLMVTSAGDEKKYSKGMDILKKAGIGLVIIGLAWLIVSVVFWLIKNLVA